MLSVTDVGRITKEAILEAPPTFTSAEALALRARIEADLADMKKQGVVPECLYDFD